MICMLESNSNLKSFMFFLPSELAGFLTLDSLLVHHLCINQMSNSLPSELTGFLSLNSLLIHHL